MFEKEAEVTNRMYMRIELRIEGKKRKRKYVKIDERIERTLTKYEETGDTKS